ncbi:hypothetical protein H0H92_003977 [Tricholoma furcatifolium]|nr:hypothetical protein H0H92_003977 [Tricholoma furcatifolium]
MPRWGHTFNHPVASSMEEILNMISCLLKGLIYLHDNRIAHGDISSGNILVNHFGCINCEFDSDTRKSLRWHGRLAYALFDFDLSTKFPSSWSDEQCRLPAERSWQGTPGFVPPDTWQGEFDFDPFALDVGALGILLSAKQALRFLEDEVYPRTTPEQLRIQPEPLLFLPKRGRWDDLDPAFVKEWEAYREPPVSLSTRVLRFVCENIWVLHTIQFLRKKFHLIRQAIRKSKLFAP